MKRKIKLVLDIVMLILTLTFFNKRFFGMKYHEIGGYVLIAITAVHVIINIKTITAMCKKFFKVPTEIKVGAIVDILLLVCYLWIGFSGIHILHGMSSNSMIFKLGHMFAGGLAVILLGIHIGLHICRKPMPTLTAIIISVVVLCFGIYGVAKSDEVRWISMPFTVSMTSNNGQPLVNAEHKQQKPQGKGQGEWQGKGQGRNMTSLTPVEKVENATMFLGMILSLTMLTYWLVMLKKKRNK